MYYNSINYALKFIFLSGIKSLFKFSNKKILSGLFCVLFRSFSLFSLVR